jgi:hypothetical protein
MNSESQNRRSENVKPEAEVSYLGEAFNGPIHVNPAFYGCKDVAQIRDYRVTGDAKMCLDHVGDSEEQKREKLIVS